MINPSAIYAPADGTALYIDKTDEFLKIAIRMSPFNVHLNRTPITGKIVKIQHQPGKHKNVYFARVEEVNERNLIVMENSDLVCELLQITGSFARRIECWVELDEKIDQGSQIGIIRFGSQTNLLINMKNELDIEPQCSVGDKVQAGLTVLASIK